MERLDSLGLGGGHLISNQQVRRTITCMQKLHIDRGVPLIYLTSPYGDASRCRVGELPVRGAANSPR